MTQSNLRSKRKSQNSPLQNCGGVYAKGVFACRAARSTHSRAFKFCVTLLSVLLPVTTGAAESGLRHRVVRLLERELLEFARESLALALRLEQSLASERLLQLEDH